MNKILLLSAASFLAIYSGFANPEHEGFENRTLTLKAVSFPGSRDEGIFPTSFKYSWRVPYAAQGQKADERSLAEETPFYDLRTLLLQRTGIPADEQYSVRFTGEDMLSLETLYKQGGLKFEHSFCL